MASEHSGCKSVKSSYYQQHLRSQLEPDRIRRLSLSQDENFDGQMGKYIKVSPSNLDPHANMMLAIQAGHPIYYTHYPGWYLPYSHNIRHPMFRSGVIYPTPDRPSGYKTVKSVYNPFDPEH